MKYQINKYRKMLQLVLQYCYNYYYKVDFYYQELMLYIYKNQNKLCGPLFMLVYIIRVKIIKIVEYQQKKHYLQL